MWAQPATNLVKPAAAHPSSLVGTRIAGLDGRWADITIEQTEAALRLHVHVLNGRLPGDAWHYERQLDVELRVAHPTVSTFNGRWCPYVLDPQVHRGGLLTEIAAWLCSELCDDDTSDYDGCSTPDGDWLDCEVEGSPAIRASIYSACEWFGALALKRCDSDASMPAREPPRDLRRLVYVSQANMAGLESIAVFVSVVLLSERRVRFAIASSPRRRLWRDAVQRG